MYCVCVLCVCFVVMVISATYLPNVDLCVTFGSTTYSVNEGGTSEIVLLLDKEIARPVNVFIEFDDNSATCKYASFV